MKKNLLIAFIFLSTSLYAQTIKKNILSEKFSVGFYPSIRYYEQVIDLEKKEYARLFSFEFHPFVKYNVYKNLFVGVQGATEFYRSNFYEKKSLKELGLNARYVLPVKIDKGLLRILKFYVEAGYYRTNFIQYNEVVNIGGSVEVPIHEDYVYDDRMIYDKLSFPVGMQIRFFRNLHFDVNWQYNKYLKGSHLSGMMGSFTYYL
jgi:hypothetical protein